MKGEDVLKKLITRASKNWPRIWREVDIIRSLKGEKIPVWEPAVFLPFDGWYNILCENLGKQQLELSEVGYAQVLQAIGAWRPAQDIAHFDPDLFASLVSTSLEGDLPVDVLTRLPAWAIYVEAPLVIEGRQQAGFLVYLDQRLDRLTLDLKLLCISSNELLKAYSIPLGNWSLQEALDRYIKETLETSELLGIPVKHKENYGEGLGAVLNLVLYLCTYGFAENETKTYPQYPRPKKINRGWRLFPPEKPRVHHLGKKLGQMIREAATGHAGSHAAKRPHIRRAHWHGFWHGKKGEAVLKVRWLPPIPVAMQDDDE